MFEEAKGLIEKHIAPDLTQRELDIFDFRIEHRGKIKAVVMIIDHRQGGVTVDECSHINKAVGKFIEDNHLLEGDYTIEVSSPGLDSPLKTVKDFHRVKGRKVKFHLTQAIENKVEHDGVIANVEGDNVCVAIKGKEIMIPFALIQKAVQII